MCIEVNGMNSLKLHKLLRREGIHTYKHEFNSLILFKCGEYLNTQLRILNNIAL